MMAFAHCHIHNGLLLIVVRLSKLYNNNSNLFYLICLPELELSPKKNIALIILKKIVPALPCFFIFVNIW